jgi:hypothetical protein
MSKTLGVTSNAWILSAAAFLASRYQSPGSRKAPTMTDGSGRNFGALWAFWDRDTSLWKMSQACLPLTTDTPSVRSSVTWPTSGMTVNGRCYPLPTLARPISESASGLWPTPSSQESQPTQEFIDEVRSSQKDTHERLYLPGRKWHTQRTLSRVVHTWPTPTARDHKDGSYCPNVEVNGLLGRAVWPTPRANSAMAATITEGADPDRYPNLETVVKKRDPSVVSGALNPTWVEWLMGFPSGWTD